MFSIWHLIISEILNLIKIHLFDIDFYLEFLFIDILFENILYLDWFIVIIFDNNSIQNDVDFTLFFLYF